MMQVSGILAQQNKTQARRIAAVDRQKRTVLEYPLTKEFPWSLMSFGWSYVLTTGVVGAGKVRILTGDIIKNTYTPVAVTEADVTIGATDTYVGVKCYRNMTNAAIFVSSSKPVSDDTWFKRWFYIFKTVSSKAYLQRIGHWPGNIDISGYGD